MSLALVATACSGVQQPALEPEQPVGTARGTLLLEVRGARNTEGSINVSLFRSAEGFPDDSASVFRSASLSLTTGSAPVVRFESVNHGDYAVSILHDENGNGSMDTGFLGVPSEGFGFSNNPRVGFGAPSFESCRFRFDEPELTLLVRLRYF